MPRIKQLTLAALVALTLAVGGVIVSAGTLPQSWQATRRSGAAQSLPAM